MWTSESPSRASRRDPKTEINRLRDLIGEQLWAPEKAGVQPESPQIPSGNSFLYFMRRSIRQICRA